MVTYYDKKLVGGIGYEMAGGLKVFYRVPILALSTNDHREISTNEQIDRVMFFVDIDHQSFSIYLDHDESFRANLNEDGVVNYSRFNLPPIFSPSRTVHSSNAEHAEAEAEVEHAEEEADVEHGHAQQGEQDTVDAPIPVRVVYPDVDVNQFEFVKREATQPVVANQMEEEEEEESVLVQPSQHMDNQMEEEDVEGSTTMRRSARQNKFTYAMKAEDATSDSDDEDYDPGVLVDSDNEIGDSNGDLYVDNVDEDEPEQKKREEIKRESTTERK